MHDILTNPNVWQQSDAEQLYRIREWGAGFFQTGDDGALEILLPQGVGGKRLPVKITDVVALIQQQKLQLPALLRFPDIFAERISQLHYAFAKAIEKHDYSACYRGVFPIKVNQKERILRDVSRFGAAFHYGFEVGSKAELIAALSCLDNPEAYLICNGYKDATYIRLALRARQAGLNVVLVVEMLSELTAILDEAEKLGVRPALGVRYRLSKSGSGRWSPTNGESGLFGLSGLEVIRAVDILREADALDCLGMLHFHQGSQLCDLSGIRQGVHEAVRVYVDLINEGAPLGALNLGGGLAIDYDGTATAAQGSKNYSLEQYCDALVYETLRVLEGTSIPHPQLLTESGRSVSAHASALIFEVFDANYTAPGDAPPEIPLDAHPRISEIASEILERMQHQPASLRSRSNRWRGELQNLFNDGAVSLREMTMIDQTYQFAVDAIGTGVPQSNPPQLPSHIPGAADIIYGNFSVFQSLPDHWALGQTFPVLPIHRLNEKPNRHAILADLTCDSDGKVKTYIPSEDAESLPVHDTREGEPYLFGAFLVGAYQETLGDKHNLFGTPHVVSVTLEDGVIQARPVSRGESVEDILRSVEYEPDELLSRVRKIAVAAGNLAPSELDEFLSQVADGMRDYTYLTSPSDPSKPTRA